MSFDTFKNEKGDDLYHVKLPEEIEGCQDYMDNVETKEWFTYAASPVDAIGHVLHFKENICDRTNLYFFIIKKNYNINDIASEIVEMEITDGKGKRLIRKYPLLEKSQPDMQLKIDF